MCSAPLRMLNKRNCRGDNREQLDNELSLEELWTTR